MKLPKPREELISDILFGLDRGLKPIRMVTWNREWLSSLDDRELTRCWLDSAELRLNPTNSTDFTEAGISLAERHARIIEFVCAVPTPRLGHLAIELIERALNLEERLGTAREGEAAFRNLLLEFAGNAAGARQRARQKYIKGAAKRWENDATQPMKASIRVEWSKWNSDRVGYGCPKPRDFRREMERMFPEANVDTLKNWMSSWGRGK